MASLYRLLKPEEWDRINFLFESKGITTPSPQVANIAIKEVNGEIRAAWVIQAMLHAEPGWIHPDEKFVNLQAMLDLIEEPLVDAWYLACPETEAATKICEFAGMENTGLIVYRKHVVKQKVEVAA